MTSIEGGADRSGYRVIRRVAGGRESPWPGALVATNDGISGVVVDAAVLTDDWRGWDAAASGHLLRALDVIRRADGHDVLLPVCTERVLDFLERRRVRTPLTPGEAVNIAVSLVRGVVEAADGDGGDRGTWWLTDAGRPVLATGSSDEPVIDETLKLLDHIAHATPIIADAVAQVTDAVRGGSLRREADRLEAALFSAQAPRPLGTTVFGSRSARSLTAHREEEPVVPLPDADRPHWSTALARHVDAEWAEMVSKATTGAWRALRSRPAGGRRRPWIAAAAIAGVVVTGGLLWPVASDEPATAGAEPDTPALVSTSAEPAPAPTASAAPQPPAAPDDLAAVTDALLTARVDCDADAACLSGLQESPDRALLPGVINLASDQRSVTLLDEFGGVAVLRVDGVLTDETGSATSQLVVIVRVEDRWLLRDVHDVAQQ